MSDRAVGGLKSRLKKAVPYELCCGADSDDEESECDEGYGIFWSNKDRCDGLHKVLPELVDDSESDSDDYCSGIRSEDEYDDGHDGFWSDDVDRRSMPEPLTRTLHHKDSAS